MRASDFDPTLGASHQTSWTGVVAKPIELFGRAAGSVKTLIGQKAFATSEMIRSF